MWCIKSQRREEVPIQEAFKGNNLRTTLLCIDSYENSVPTGRFYNGGCEEGKTFCSLTQFLVAMEKLLDEIQFPQSFVAVRTFAPTEPYSSVPPGEGEVREGKVATFLIRMLFRQNASWQGSVTWIENNMEVSFRSALELILLMDSAMKKESSV